MEDKRKSVHSAATDSSHFGQAYDDEISLIDLWLVMVRHRRLIMIIAGVITALAVVYALIRSPKYNYTTAIEIGTQVQNDAIEPVESAATVMGKLMESYIPAALHAYYSTHPDDTFKYKFKARVPKDSQLVLLESSAPESRGATVINLEEEIVQALVKDNERLTKTISNGLELQQKTAQEQLAQLKNEAANLRSDMAAIGKNEDSLRRQFDNGGSRANHARGRVDSSLLSLLMIEGEMEQQRQSSLRAQLADNARDQQTQRQTLNDVAFRLQNLLSTRAVVAPQRSIEAANLAPALVVLLGLIAGAMVGVFSAFLWEFLLQAQTVLASKKAQVDSGAANGEQRVA